MTIFKPTDNLELQEGEAEAASTNVARIVNYFEARVDIVLD